MNSALFIFVLVSSVYSASVHNSSRGSLALRSDTVFEEQRAVSVGRFFCPGNPEWFITWRNEVLRSQGLYSRTNPLVFNTITIHENLIPLVFPHRAIDLIKDVFPDETVDRVSNTARAIIRAIYTIHIYSDLFGPLPRHERHPIYTLYPQVVLSGDRLKVSRILTFMFIIPRIRPVWDAWKYLADLYGVSSVLELSRMVGSVAAGHRLKWFEEIYI